MKKILITRKLLKSNEDRASKIFDVKLNSKDEIYSQKKIIELSKGCDGILTLFTDKVDEETINKLSDTIKVISNFGVGFGNINLEVAKKRNIAVTNTPEVITDATAEIAMLLILGAARRASEGIEYSKKSNWNFSTNFLMGKQLTGARLGILGMGRIGRAVAKRARVFGMMIHYHNRSKLSSELEIGATYHDSIKSLFFCFQIFLSINCSATKETENIINAETLEYFPTGAIITNSARGDMIDDEAMINALNKKKIYALGLDVYKGEPNLNSGYLNIKKCFLFYLILEVLLKKLEQLWET